MALSITQQDIKLGQSIDTVVKNTATNFSAVFDTLEEDVGMSLSLAVDSNYVMTISLNNSSGVAVDTKTVDLPIESMVIGAQYNEAGKELVLTLQNGQSIKVQLDDIIRGLVPDSRTINGKKLESNITLTQDDVGDGTTYKRFSSEEKTKLGKIDNSLLGVTASDIGKVKAITVNGDAVPISAGTATITLTQDDIGDGANYKRFSDAEKTKLSEIHSSLVGVTADDIGKVKDVTVNGESVLNANGVAAITLEALKSGYVTVGTTDLVKCPATGLTDYYAIKVVDTDTAFEVYNSTGAKIITQPIRYSDGYLYICIGKTAIDCIVRKASGHATGGGGGGVATALAKSGHVSKTTSGRSQVTLSNGDEGLYVASIRDMSNNIDYTGFIWVGSLSRNAEGSIIRESTAAKMRLNYNSSINAITCYWSTGAYATTDEATIISITKINFV